VKSSPPCCSAIVKCSTALGFFGCTSKLVWPVGGQLIRSLDKGRRRVRFGGSIGASSVPLEARNVELRNDIVGVGELIALKDRCDVVGTRILERGIALLTARGDTMGDSCRQAAS
jgi:hypothetical protein